MAERVYSEHFDPDWAPHVEGSHEPQRRDPETGLPEEQKVHARCTTCGAEFRRTCSSGAVRGHISTFARVHLHRDPFAPVPVKS